MKGDESNRICVLHIVDAIKEIESYCNETSLDSFVENSMFRNAVIRQLEIIGEAANRVTPGFRETHHGIKWKSIIGLRNILIHEYFGVDYELVIQIIRDDLPELKAEIERVVSGL